MKIFASSLNSNSAQALSSSSSLIKTKKTQTILKNHQVSFCSKVMDFPLNLVGGATESLSSGFVPALVGTRVLFESFLEWFRMGDFCSEFRIMASSSSDADVQYGVAIPIVGELAFRGALQKLIVPTIIRSVVGIVAPHNATLTDKKMQKQASILITSLLFGAVYYQETMEKCGGSIAYSLIRGIFGTALGFYLGQMAESKKGIAGAIGAHMIRNITMLSWAEMSCDMQYLRFG